MQALRDFPTVLLLHIHVLPSTKPNHSFRAKALLCSVLESYCNSSNSISTRILLQLLSFHPPQPTKRFSFLSHFLEICIAEDLAFSWMNFYLSRRHTNWKTQLDPRSYCCSTTTTTTMLSNQDNKISHPSSHSRPESSSPEEGKQEEEEEEKCCHPLQHRHQLLLL